MMLFLAVAVIVGAVTAFFFDVDTALWAGKRTVDIWLAAGLALTILSPFLEIFSFIKFIFQRAYRLFHRKKV